MCPGHAIAWSEGRAQNASRQLAWLIASEALFAQDSTVCGIFGLVGKRLPELNLVLARASRALAHRGPDDEGIEILPCDSEPVRCVGLAARRLAILDLSAAGHQPMHDPQTGCWLVFNGEIFNFREIRTELEHLGRSFCSECDTEVLLKAYGQWGDACVERLRGMFAFAVWDARKERLFLARDRLGVKPLYYSVQPDYFAFSSEVRALMASGLVPRRLEAAGLASYLAFGAVQDPVTMVEGVRSLLPGHSLVWQQGKWEDRAYWSIAEVASREPATNSRPEAVAAVQKILLEAVSLSLVSDVPLGLFLSGGVDSSSIVALAAETSKDRLETFSIVFAEGQYTEAEHSDLVAKTYGCHHRKVHLSPEQLLDYLPGALASMDQPSVDGVNTYVVALAAKRAGLTVALSGLGGDEIFAGYSSFRSVPRMMRFQPCARWLRPLGEAAESYFGLLQTSWLAKLVGLTVEDFPGNHPYFLSRALFLPSRVCVLLPQRPGRDRGDYGLEGIADFVQRIRHLDAVNQVSVLEGATYMPHMLLRDADGMSMAHALEVRVPFVDHKLWEYVLPLRGRLKLDSRLPKPLLVNALRLPRQVYLRPKMGFTLPFAEWLRGALRPVVERELRDAGESGGWPVERRLVSAVWDSFLRGKTTWSRPWSLFVLKQWIRHNIGESP